MKQSKTTNPLSRKEPWVLTAKGYEETTMRFLSPYAHTAISSITLSPNSDVLDLACGPGTVTRLVAEKVHTVTAVDFAEPMISLLDDYIIENHFTNIKTMIGDGQNLNLNNQQFDAAFSMFGLMFFSDRLKGFSELFRILKPGGAAAVSSWAPVVQSPAMQLMFGAIKAAKPDISEPEKNIESLENPDVFKKEMEDSGFSEVSIQAVTHTIEIASANTFWQEMSKGSAPIVMLKRSVEEEEWINMEAKAVKYLHQELSHLPTQLPCTAWLGLGVKLESG